MLKIVGRLFVIACCIPILACEGPAGEPGPPGAAGSAGTPGAAGENGTNGKDGAACYAGLSDRNGDGTVDEKDCRSQQGNAPMELTDAQIKEIEERAGVKECLVCHKTSTPNMVWDFTHSKHAVAGRSCIDCHADNPAIADGKEGHRKLPRPETCKTCHPKEFEGHRANRHSIASIRNYECGRFDDFPRFFETGAGYHFTDDDVKQLKDLMDSGGNGAGANENPTAIAKCMQCHNVENRCDSCHTRHRFSVKEARDPNACATCHMGPDHPQIEMYETSKHGTMFAAEGDTKRVPVCVDCHMPYNGKIFPKKKDADGKEYVSHDLSLTSAYGPVGGGTTRASFVVENNRVKFVNKGDATDVLWYDWADGKVYTTSDGTTVAYDDIYKMSIADKDDDGRHDYKVVQVPDDATKLKTARNLMLDVCKKCHAQNFADERLLVADLIHQNTKIAQGDALDLVVALAATKIGPYFTDDRPINPENGTNNWAANMKVRNLTELERYYFHILKYDQVKTWKGAYHFNPDYTHWYGWTELSMKIGAMGDMATQQVLQHMWINGRAYPGPNKNPLRDGLYQGTLFAQGLGEKSQVENYYDKFPGPRDGHLDWYHAVNGTYIAPDADGTSNGDGIPDNTQPIDIDMDGTDDLLKKDGNGADLGPGVYYAPASGKVVTFN